jgi:hypothetical protein
MKSSYFEKIMLTKNLVQTLQKTQKNAPLSRSLYKKRKKLMTGKLEEDPLKFKC